VGLWDCFLVGAVMANDHGVPASPSGSHASHEAADASSPSVSIPNAVTRADLRSRPWGESRREKMSALHRARCGAPVGYATVYGVHVPYGASKPVRYWAKWLGDMAGPEKAHEAAREFVIACERNRWRMAEKLQELMDEKRAVHRNRSIIRELEFWSRRR